MKADIFKASLRGCPSHFTATLHANADEPDIADGCLQTFALSEGRCWWLLMTQDRVESDSFPYRVLLYAGVRRASVSEVAASRSGLIDTIAVKLLSRKGLKLLVVECYQSTKQEFKRLLG